ncbi:hypothetical protein ACFFRR_009580 [Megaselia abdita]
MSSRVKRVGGYTWPGKNYLGPGNPINSGEPVDDVDWDAYIYDLEYELADTKENIREADREAISNFIDDFKNNGQISEVSAIIGLSLKYGFESVFGVRYSDMSVNKTFSQLIYSSREKAGEGWRNLPSSTKSGYNNYTAFKTTSARTITRSYQEGGHYYEALKRDYNATHNNKAGGSRSDNSTPAKRQRIETDSYNTEDNTTTDLVIEKPVHTSNTNNNMDVDVEQNYAIESDSGRVPNTGRGRVHQEEEIPLVNR